MSTHITYLLNQWRSQPDCEWVMATLIGIEGSSYRHLGAMMFINSNGQFFGMISGGCLESDIVLKSRRTMMDGKSRVLAYDMSDESDLSWRLGIGCGGKISILLQSISEKNHYLYLNELYEKLVAGEQCQYLQNLTESKSENVLLEPSEKAHQRFIINQNNSNKCHYKNEEWFINRLEPQTHLAIFGGGIDARPLVSMAHTLGWEITLCDSRQVYARERDFPLASTIIKTPLVELEKDWLSTVDACVIMHHNVNLDAQALQFVQHSNCDYIGLLGPTHRTKRVLDSVGITYEDLSKPLFNPIGLDLGGNGPEAIALAIVGEIQATLTNSTSGSLSLNDRKTSVKIGGHG